MTHGQKNIKLQLPLDEIPLYLLFLIFRKNLSRKFKFEKVWQALRVLYMNTYQYLWYLFWILLRYER